MMPQIVLCHPVQCLFARAPIIPYRHFLQLLIPSARIPLRLRRHVGVVITDRFTHPVSQLSVMCVEGFPAPAFVLECLLIQVQQILPVKSEMAPRDDEVSEDLLMGSVGDFVVVFFCGCVGLNDVCEEGIPVFQCLKLPFGIFHSPVRCLRGVDEMIVGWLWAGEQGDFRDDWLVFQNVVPQPRHSDHFTSEFPVSAGPVVGALEERVIVLFDVVFEVVGGVHIIEAGHG